MDFKYITKICIVSVIILVTFACKRDFELQKDWINVSICNYLDPLILEFNENQLLIISADLDTSKFLFTLNKNVIQLQNIKTGEKSNIDFQSYNSDSIILTSDKFVCKSINLVSYDYYKNKYLKNIKEIVTKDNIIGYWNIANDFDSLVNDSISFEFLNNNRYIFYYKYKESNNSQYIPYFQIGNWKTINYKMLSILSFENITDKFIFLNNMSDNSFSGVLKSVDLNKEVYFQKQENSTEVDFVTNSLISEWKLDNFIVKNENSLDEFNEEMPPEYISFVNKFVYSFIYTKTHKLVDGKWSISANCNYILLDKVENRHKDVLRINKLDDNVLEVEFGFILSGVALCKYIKTKEFTPN